MHTKSGGLLQPLGPWTAAEDRIIYGVAKTRLTLINFGE
jgi:hypothetical protein